MTSKVIFRKWQQEIIALFPEEPADIHGIFCSSYMRVGQHSGADYNYIIQQSTPATPYEYQALKEELEKIGYTLKVYKRVPANAWYIRRKEVKRMLT